MKYYFQLQYKRLLRHIIDFGIYPAVALPLGLLLWVGNLYFIFHKTTYAAAAVSGSALFFLLRLHQHTRLQALQRWFNKTSYRQLRWIENALLLLFFIPALLWYQHYLWAVGLGAAACLIVFMPSLPRTPLTLPTPFFRLPFEFARGFRQYWYLILLAYFLCFMGLRVGNYNLSAFGLLLCMGSYLLFYQAMEPKEYVRIFRCSAAAFLWHKWRIALYYSLLSTSPMLLAMLIVFPLHHLHTALLSLASISYLSLMVWGKYTSFPRPISFLHALLFGLSFVFPPLLMALLPWYFIRASRHLKTLLS